MRTKVLTLLMSVAFIGASAQTIIKEVTLDSETPLASVLSDEEMLTADSLVIKGFLKHEDYSTMRKMCQEGRLRGIDLSGVVQDRSGLAIPDNAFYAGGSDSSTETVKDVRLEYVTLPKNLQFIGKRAFAGTQIRSAVLSRTLISIGEDSFKDCKSLKEVTVCSPDFLGMPSSCAFDGIPSDAVLYVPKGYRDRYVGNIRWQPFGSIVEKDDLFNVKVVDLSQGSLETQLGDAIYTTDSLVIKGRLCKSDGKALLVSTYLGRVRSFDMSDATVEDDLFGKIPSIELKYGGYDMGNIRYFRFPKGMNKMVEAVKGAHLMKFELPSSLREMGLGSFRSCEIYDDIRIPEGVEKLTYFVFSNTNAGDDMYLPSTLKELGYSSIDLHKTGKFNLYINRKTPPVYSRSGFAGESETPFTSTVTDDLPEGYTLYVPVGTAEVYRTDKCWRHFKNIIETPELDGGTSAIGGVRTEDAAADNEQRIYTLDGRYVGKDMDRLGKGVYVVGGRKVVR